MQLAMQLPAKQTRPGAQLHILVFLTVVLHTNVRTEVTSEPKSKFLASIGYQILLTMGPAREPLTRGAPLKMKTNKVGSKYTNHNARK